MIKTILKIVFWLVTVIFSLILLVLFQDTEALNDPFYILFAVLIFGIPLAVCILVLARLNGWFESKVEKNDLPTLDKSVTSKNLSRIEPAGTKTSNLKSKITKISIEIADEINGTHENGDNSELDTSYIGYDLLSSDFSDECRFLLYVARADGQMLEKELVIITKTLTKLTKDVLLESEGVRKMFRNNFRTPTYAAFRQICGRLITDGKTDLKLLQQAAVDIVTTQNNVYLREQELLDYIEKRFQNIQ